VKKRGLAIGMENGMEYIERAMNGLLGVKRGEFSRGIGIWKPFLRN